MNTNAITQLEQDIISILKKEYSFYQSLYILLDKQRDIIKYDKDENLLDIYAEVERCQRRIKDSESKLKRLRESNEQMFRVASVHPEAKKYTNCIITLLKKNMQLVKDNEEYARDRHNRIKTEMEELQNSHKILKYMNDSVDSPQFIDGKQ